MGGAVRSTCDGRGDLLAGSVATAHKKARRHADCTAAWGSEEDGATDGVTNSPTPGRRQRLGRKHPRSEEDAEERGDDDDDDDETAGQKKAAGPVPPESESAELEKRTKEKEKAELDAAAATLQRGYRGKQARAELAKRKAAAQAKLAGAKDAVGATGATALAAKVVASASAVGA